MSRKGGMLAAIVVAVGMAISAAHYTWTAADDGSASGNSQNCSARYAALLDLAELARRDGKAADVVVRGLSDRRGALSGCVQPIRATRAAPTINTR